MLDIEYLCGSVEIVVNSREVKVLVSDDTLDNVDLDWIDMLELNIGSEEIIVDVVEVNAAVVVVVVEVVVVVVVVVIVVVVLVVVVVVLVVVVGIVVVVGTNKTIEILRNELNLMIKLRFDFISFD